MCFFTVAPYMAAGGTMAPSSQCYSMAHSSSESCHIKPSPTYAGLHQNVICTPYPIHTVKSACPLWAMSPYLTVLDPFALLKGAPRSSHSTRLFSVSTISISPSHQLCPRLPPSLQTHHSTYHTSLLAATTINTT